MARMLQDWRKRRPIQRRLFIRLQRKRQTTQFLVLAPAFGARDQRCPRGTESKSPVLRELPVEARLHHPSTRWARPWGLAWARVSYTAEAGRRIFIRGQREGALALASARSPPWSGAAAPRV